MKKLQCTSTHELCNSSITPLLAKRKISNEALWDKTRLKVTNEISSDILQMKYTI